MQISFLLLLYVSLIIFSHMLIRVVIMLRILHSYMSVLRTTIHISSLSPTTNKLQPYALCTVDSPMVATVIRLPLRRIHRLVSSTQRTSKQRVNRMCDLHCSIELKTWNVRPNFPLYSLPGIFSKLEKV